MRSGSFGCTVKGLFLKDRNKEIREFDYNIRD